MRVVVVVEQAWDPASIEVDAATGQVDWSRAAPAPAPGCLEAVELGLRLGAVTVYGLGGGVEALLRTCLAMGAAGVARAPDVAAVASGLAGVRFDLLLAPNRAGDQCPSPIGPTLAGLLDLPQATAVDELAARPGAREAVVRRRLDRGEREELALPLPAVVALEPGLARPRAATPAALIAAGAATIPELPAAAGSPPRPVLLGHRAPRPAPPRMRSPGPELQVEARIAAVLGTAETRQREVATGPADEVAAHIQRLLEEHGYL